MLSGSSRTRVGLDVSATAVRAVAGRAFAGAAEECLVQAVAVDGEAGALPLALTAEGRGKPVVGRAALGRRRREPHLVCLDFLPALGGARKWRLGRREVDAAGALGLVFEGLRKVLPPHEGVTVAVPPYLQPSQVQTVIEVAGRARLPVQAWLAAPAAAVLEAYAQEPWPGPALVVDVDEHALSWSVVQLAGGQARVRATQAVTRLGLKAWYGRLLDAVADRCIRHCRRDPRDSADADQALYDQVDGILEACRRGQMADVVVPMKGWGQNLVLRAEEVTAFCAPLARLVGESLRAACALVEPDAGPPVVLLGAAAGRLPGLAEAAAEVVGNLADGLPASPAAQPTLNDEDFGEALLPGWPSPASRSWGGLPDVRLLAADAAARGAWVLGQSLAEGAAAQGFLSWAPLPAGRPARGSVQVPAMPGPRLHFGGRDFVLRKAVGRPFLVGGHPGCDLMVDGAAYPMVSGTHCEIHPRGRTYVLRDRSRCGTLVNDRPVTHEIVLQAGDWIRLGPGGPAVGFLGEPGEPARLATTA